MKKWIFMLAVLINLLTGYGEISEDVLDDCEDLVKITSVEDTTDQDRRDRDKKTEVLEIGFSGGEKLDIEEEELLEKVWFRVAVEITDKAEEKTYFAEKKQKNGTFSREYIGHGSWEFKVPYGDIERVEISAYAVQYGVMDGDTFVPFLEEYDDVDSYEELKQRSTTPYPEKIRLTRTIYVSEL